jgi:midasin
VGSDEGSAMDVNPDDVGDPLDDANNEEEDAEDEEEAMDEDEVNAAAGGGGIEEEPVVEADDDVASKSKKEYGAAFGLSDEQGKDSVLNELNEEAQERSKGSTAPEGASGGSASRDPTTDASGKGRDTSSSTDATQAPQRKQNEAPNPFKTRGDINQAWFRRLEVMDHDGEAQEEVEAGGADEESGDRGAFEYTEEEGGSQVLAAALEEEETSALPESNERPATEDERPMVEESRPAVDKEGPTAPGERESKKRSREEEMDASRKERSPDELSEEEIPDEEEEAQPDGPTVQEGVERDRNFTHTGRTDEEDMGLLYEESHFVDENAGVGGVTQEARGRWQLHRSRTDPLASRLCEQLRLVLEPLQASRLRGDYRSGKRINMRKVVGYVASGFRKDKIWMRRTKPSKRDYQVQRRCL